MTEPDFKELLENTKIDLRTSAYDVKKLISELQIIIDAKIDKIYQLNKEHFLLVLHLPKIGKKMLKITFPRAMFLSEIKEDMPTLPNQFCISLRKFLQNGRIRSITQFGYERIVKLEITTKDNTFFLIIELFSSGNLVLCTGENIIKLALVQHKWKDRTIRGNVEYLLPGTKIDPFSLEFEELKDHILKSEKENIVKCLALDLSLGGKYAEEVCVRSGIDKDFVNLSELKNDQIRNIFETLAAVDAEEINSRIIITKDQKNKEIAFYSPIVMQNFETDKSNKVFEIESFSKAIDILNENKKDIKVSRYAQKIKTLEKRIETQEKQLETQDKNIEKNQQKGEIIFNNYEKITAVINHIKKNEATISKEELKGTPIKSVDKKNKTFNIDME